MACGAKMVLPAADSGPTHESEKGWPFTDVDVEAGGRPTRSVRAKRLVALEAKGEGCSSSYQQA